MSESPPRVDAAERASGGRERDTMRIYRMCTKKGLKIRFLIELPGASTAGNFLKWIIMALHFNVAQIDYGGALLPLNVGSMSRCLSISLPHRP